MRTILHAGLDNLAHWFGVFGPYTVYTRVPFGQDDYLEFAYGAFTERQALRLLAEFGAHGGSVTRFGRLVAVKS